MERNDLTIRLYRARPLRLTARTFRLARQRYGRPFEWAVVRFVIGIVLLIGVVMPYPVVWVGGGVVLISTSFRLFDMIADASVRRPALVCTGSPKWGGVRRDSWRLDVDPIGEYSTSESYAMVIETLADLLTRAAGEPLVFTANDNGTEPTTLRAGLSQTGDPLLVSWRIGGPPKATAADNHEGIWMRCDFDEHGPAAVNLLVSDGPHSEALIEMLGR